MDLCHIKKADPFWVLSVYFDRCPLTPITLDTHIIEKGFSNSTCFARPHGQPKKKAIKFCLWPERLFFPGYKSLKTRPTNNFFVWIQQKLFNVACSWSFANQCLNTLWPWLLVRITHHHKAHLRAKHENNFIPLFSFPKNWKITNSADEQRLIYSIVIFAHQNSLFNIHFTITFCLHRHPGKQILWDCCAHLQKRFVNFFCLKYQKN